MKKLFLFIGLIFSGFYLSAMEEEQSTQQALEGAGAPPLYGVRLVDEDADSQTGEAALAKPAGNQDEASSATASSTLLATLVKAASTAAGAASTVALAAQEFVCAQMRKPTIVPGPSDMARALYIEMSRAVDSNSIPTLEELCKKRYAFQAVVMFGENGFYLIRNACFKEEGLAISIMGLLIGVNPAVLKSCDARSLDSPLHVLAFEPNKGPFYYLLKRSGASFCRNHRNKEGYSVLDLLRKGYLDHKDKDSETFKKAIEVKTKAIADQSSVEIQGYVFGLPSDVALIEAVDVFGKPSEGVTEDVAAAAVPSSPIAAAE